MGTSSLVTLGMAAFAAAHDVALVAAWDKTAVLGGQVAAWDKTAVLGGQVAAWDKTAVLGILQRVPAVAALGEESKLSVGSGLQFYTN